MTTCDRYHAWMVEAIYQELDDARRSEFEDHVHACADCTALFAELQATAETMNQRRRPDPGPEFWNGYWQRLQQRVAREGSAVVDASRFARRRSLGSWGYRVAAVVAVLAAGVWIGRTVFAPSGVDAPQVAVEPVRDDSPARSEEPRDSAVTRPDSEAQLARDDVKAPLPIDSPAGERTSESQGRPTDAGVVLASSDEEAHRYIERSQLLLLAVLNGPDDAAHYGAQRERAGELVRVASSVREGSSDRRVQELVGQLELILREIAHLEENSDVDAVDVIRNRVDREGVLLRINLEQMRAPKSAPENSNGAID